MLAPIFLMIIAAGLLGFAFWLWPRHPPDTSAIPPAPPRNEPAAPVDEAKTEYLSSEDMRPTTVFNRDTIEAIIKRPR